MKTIRISEVVRVAAMGLLAVCLNAGHASAQEVKGSFTLPFEAHWGSATLTPGSYSFTVNGTDGQRVLTLFRGMKAVALIPSQSLDDEKSGPSELIAVQGEAGLSIRELHLPEIGMVLRYPVYEPRPNRVNEKGEIAEVIPVSGIGK